MKKFAALISVGLGLAALSGNAAAVTANCSFIQFEIAQGICTGACITDFQQKHPECFGTTSSTAGATQEIRSTTFRQMYSISQAVTARNTSKDIPLANLSDGGKRFGMAAGNAGSQWNVWGSLGEDKNKFDGAVFVDATNFSHKNTSNTNVTNAVLGADFQLSPTMAVGVSAAFDSGSGSVQSFSSLIAGGAIAANPITTLNTSGYTIAPYLGWQISKEWTLDASLGIGSIKLNSSETSGKADRLFYGTNISYTNWSDNWQITGKGSYLHGEEKYGNMISSVGTALAGTASTNKLDQLNIGGQAGYWMNGGVMPYFGLNYASDLSRSTSSGALAGTDIGNSAFVVSLGVNFFSLKNDLTGGIAYNQETGRTHSTNSNLAANVNYRF